MSEFVVVHCHGVLPHSGVTACQSRQKMGHWKSVRQRCEIGHLSRTGDRTPGRHGRELALICNLIPNFTHSFRSTLRGAIAFRGRA